MVIISINFGIDGSVCLTDNGKIIKHSSFNRINNRKNGDITIINADLLTRLFKNTGYVINDVDCFVFVGFSRKWFDEQHYEFDITLPKPFLVSPSIRYQNVNLLNQSLFELESLNPPYTKEPLEYLEAYFISNKFNKPCYIVNPDIAYNSFGYYSSNFNKSINLTISSQDETPIDGSLVTLSRDSKISPVKYPRISVGKLYTKMTELLGFGLGRVNYSTIENLSTRYNIPVEKRNIIDEGINNPLSAHKNVFELNFFNDISDNLIRQEIVDNSVINFRSFDVSDINQKTVLKTSAYTQKIVENTVMKTINDLIEEYGGNFSRNITLSGDVFNNRKLVTKVLKTFKDYDIHIPPINTGECLSLGGAFFIQNLFGNRKYYDADFLTTTNTIFMESKINDGEDISSIGEVLNEEPICYVSKFLEYGQKSHGSTGIVFDVKYKNVNELLKKVSDNPFDKPTIVIKEENYLDYFMDYPYTFNNNTVTTPINPSDFVDYIHDDGTVNVFVVKKGTPVYNILTHSNRDYLGHLNFTSIERNAIMYMLGIYKIMKDLSVRNLLFKEKLHTYGLHE